MKPSESCMGPQGARVERRPPVIPGFERAASASRADALLLREAASSMRFLLAASVFALALPSCASDSPRPRVCAPQPAFRLTVRAEGSAALPETTLITVKAGGGVETYVPAKPAACPSMVFCKAERAGDTDAGALPPSDAGCDDAGAEGPDAGALDVVAITCVLWTDGAAEVRVEATGFTTDVVQLQAMNDECGTVTKSATITVKRVTTDGGM